MDVSRSAMGLSLCCNFADDLLNVLFHECEERRKEYPMSGFHPCVPDAGNSGRKLSREKF